MDYVPTKTIKGQAVAVFIAKLTQVDGTIPWTVEVDGSCHSTGAGIGIKIITRTRGYMSTRYACNFATSNNIVEYEATIHGLKIVKMLGATTVKLRTDSQLVTHQITKEFAAKEPQITKYVATLEQLVKLFAHFEVKKNPRSLKNSAVAYKISLHIWRGKY